eukprot:1020673-Amphidinium_carterae.1
MGDNYLTLQIGSSSSDVIQLHDSSALEAAMSPSIQSNAARRVVLTTAELQRIANISSLNHLLRT